MTVELSVAILSACAALIASGFTILGQFRLAKLKSELAAKRDEKLKKQEAEAVLSKYRDPLINAAYELQSRIFNILRLDFCHLFYFNGNEREKQYAVENTIYVIAQYFGWTEIIRRDIQFLDLGELETTKKLALFQDQICNIFLDSKRGKVLRIFRGEQRAIGESMIVYNGSNAHCCGYAQFIQNQAPSFQYWFEPIREHIDLLATDLDAHAQRLIALQHALVDLIDFLDPNYVRYPKERRLKMTQ
jgi:hypothetical protein